VKVFIFGYLAVAKIRCFFPYLQINRTISSALAVGFEKQTFLKPLKTNAK